MDSRRRPRRAVNQINVVPYIDVMLVLLIIFMVTAPMLPPGQIELPKVGQSLTPPIAPLEISFTKDETYILRDLSQKNTELARGQELAVIVARVQQQQQQRADQAVVIAADKEVRYEKVMNIMDALYQNQIKKVGLLARPNPTPHAVNHKK